METSFIVALIALVEKAVEKSPEFAAALKNIFSKSDPTAEDWETEKNAILAKSYKDFVPGSSLPG